MSDYNSNTPPILKDPHPLPDSALLDSSGPSNPTDYDRRPTLPSLISPPLLKTPHVCSEPSDKCTSKTLDVITNEQSDGQHQSYNLSQSTVSTPGLAIPGSYPLFSGDNTDALYLKEAAGSAIETVKNSAGVSTKTAQSYVRAAGETISRYLPESIVGYIAKPRSGSSLEEPAQRSATGVENLPGDSVAMLPAERHLEMLPSHDDESFTPLGRSGGVGALPGHLSEFGVAMLPDERNADRQHEVLPSRDDSSVTPFGSSGGAGVLRGPGHGIVSPGAPSHEGGYVGSGIQGVGPADRHETMANYLNPLFTTFPGLPTEATATGLPERDVPKHELKPAEGLDQLKPGHPQFLDSIDGPADQRQQPTSTDASANASIKTLYSGKQPKDLGPETLREHTAGPPQSGAAGVVVSPVEHDRKHTRHRKRSNGGSTAARKTINTSARNHPLTGHVLREKAPTIPENLSQLESDRTTTGHTSPSTSNADAATAYPSTTKPYTSARPGKTPSHDPGYRAAGIAAGTTRHSMGSSAGTDAGARRSEDGQDQLHFPTTETAGDKLHAHPHNGKKVGFMDKLKGEAKVISGKLGGNQEKIEEGRKMMGKN